MEQTKIPLEDALQNNLETSTREELCEYLDLLGMDTVDKRAPIDSLKNALLTACGQTPNSKLGKQAMRAPPTSVVKPPVNLTPYGRWGGLRMKVSLPRPEGSKLARAEGFGWNGKATYWLPYDEPISVPYPIYMILMDTKRPRAKQVKTIHPDGATEITTAWDHVDRGFRDLGVDPTTSHLPRSLTDWYQDKGEAFYHKLGERDLRTVASSCDIPVQDHDRRARPHNDILTDVLIFLFGYAESDSEVSEGETAEA